MKQSTSPSAAKRSRMLQSLTPTPNALMVPASRSSDSALCFMLAGRYTLLDHTALDTFLPDCERRGISVLMAAPFNSGILATGARDGATFFYVEADSEIKERTRRIEAACARHGVPLAAAAIQFPLHHPAVASVVTGMRSAAEATDNVAHCRAVIPTAFWDELKSLGLIDRAAPTG